MSTVTSSNWISKRYKILCISALVCVLNSVSAADAFKSGVTAYESGNYAQAIEQFEAALKQVPESAAIRHNLALAYFQENQPSEAVWQLERANRIAPTRADIQGKLEILKRQLGLPEAQMNWLTVFIRLLSLQQWVLLGTALFWITVLCLLIIPRLRQPGSSTGIRSVGASALIAFILTAVATFLSHREHATGIVLSKDPIELRVAPASAAPASNRLSPGESARVVGQHEHFLKIKTASGIEGWIASESFRPIYF